jgi:DNA-binding transcriptional LysR family regulator
VGVPSSTLSKPKFDRSGGRLRPTVDGSRFFQKVEKTFIGLAGLETSAASICSSVWVG